MRLSLSEYVKEMAECMKKEREEIPVKWRREYNQLQQDRSKQGYNEFATRFQRGRNKVTLRSQQGHNQVATRLQHGDPEQDCEGGSGGIDGEGGCGGCGCLRE